MLFRNCTRQPNVGSLGAQVVTLTVCVKVPYLPSEFSFWFSDEVHEEEQVVPHGVVLAYVGFKLLGIVEVRTANATDKALVLRNESNL